VLGNFEMFWYNRAAVCLLEGQRKQMNSEQERTPVDRPSGLFQEYVRNRMKDIFLSEDFLVNVFVDWYGQPTFIKLNW